MKSSGSGPAEGAPRLPRAPRRRRTAGGAALATLAATVVGCGGGPTILVEATRASAEQSLSVRACPPAASAVECARDYEDRQVLPPTSTALLRTLGIYVDDATSPVRLQLQRDPQGAPLQACQQVDVDVAVGPVTLRVAADRGLTRSCEPPDRCRDAGSCVAGP